MLLDFQLKKKELLFFDCFLMVAFGYCCLLVKTIEATVKKQLATAVIEQLPVVAHSPIR